MAAATLLLGIALIAGMQFAIAAVAFRKSVLSGFMCLFVPLYVYVFANRAHTNPWFMRLWYAGVGLLVLGGVLAS